MRRFKSRTHTMGRSIAMPLMYPIKHVFRNWKLFVALLIGITLAATFCAAIGVKANLSAEQTLDKQISNVLTDITFYGSLNQTNLGLAYRNLTTIEGVKSVDYVASFGIPVSTSGDNYSSSYYTNLYSFPISSRVNDEWLNKPYGGIPENYTYISAGSNLAQKVKVGDNITTILEFYQPKYWNSSYLSVNLTVAGFAELTDTGYAYISNGGGIVYYGGPVSAFSSSFGGSYGYRGDFMIIDWDNTLEKLWNTTLDSSQVNFNFAINVDRKQLITPWNTQASIDNVNTVSNKIQNEVLANYLVQTYPNNMLSSALYGYQYNFQQLLVNFIIVAIPIVFVAWYLGSTVSDVSFNIRRREIGLLSTKGLSSGQIQRLFLSEAVVIGLIGGFLGVVGGLILNQYYLGTVDLNNLFTGRLFSSEIAIITVFFGVILAVASVFWSSRKASRIPAVEALREYMPVETKSRFRFIPWIALALGSYKIIVLLLGLNIPMILYSSSGNLIISALREPMIYFDSAMTFLGPFLFFWGFTKIVIRDSTKFQQVASKIASVMGDLGALAGKNVRRNPARLAAIAFLVAFIIGFSVQVTGQVASQQDFIVRNVRQQVGADVTVTVVNASKGQLIMDEIMANISGIQSATIERTLYPQVGNDYNTMQVRVINPDNWSQSAYYEDGWFSGSSVDQMMRDLKGSNNTIILDRVFAKQYGYSLHDEVGVNFASSARKLRVIGFFGPEPQDNSDGRGVIINTGSIDSKYPVPSYYYSSFYSYVPANLFNMTYGSDIYTLENWGTRYLIKVDQGINGTLVAEQIRNLEPTEISSVDSFDYEWQQSTSLSNLSTISSLQVLDIEGLGLVFAVISASVGTALIAIVSLKERSREATLMSVRGLSFRQLVWMFLTESMAIITFSVILGVVVGVIIVYGTITSANASLYSYQLVTQRLIYPPDALATIGTYIALIYAATIGSIIVMSSQYVTKLEKMVRAR